MSRPQTQALCLTLALISWELMSFDRGWYRPCIMEKSLTPIPEADTLSQRIRQPRMRRLRYVAKEGNPVGSHSHLALRVCTGRSDVAGRRSCLF